MNFELFNGKNGMQIKFELDDAIKLASNSVANYDYVINSLAKIDAGNDEDLKSILKLAESKLDEVIDEYAGLLDRLQKYSIKK